MRGNRWSEPTKPNWWILGGSLAFVLFTLTVGFGGFSYSEEIVFAGSMAIVLFLMARLMRELEPDKQFTLVGTAVVVFIFRAIPGTGPGTTWWMIDHLKFDQQFLSILSLIGSTLDPGGHVRLSPFHGRTVDCLCRRVSHRDRNHPDSPDREHVLWPARMDGEA